MQNLTGHHWEWNWAPPGLNFKMERNMDVRWKNTVSSGLSVVIEARDDDLLRAEDVYLWEYTAFPGYTVSAPGGHDFPNPRFGEFIRYTAYCLDLLYLTLPGKALLEFIHRQGKKVAVTPSPTGGNQYRVIGNHGFCRLRQDFNDQAKREKGILFLAAQQFKQDGVQSIRSLYEAFSGKWRYFSNHGTWPDDKNKPAWTRDDARELTTRGEAYVTCMNQISWEEFTGWLMKGENNRIDDLIARTNSGPGVNSDLLRENLRDNIIVFFYGQSPSGTTTDIMVDFNTILWREHFEMTRPPAIGLGHELVHAWYAVQGKQPDLSDTNIVLTEMACVGLGPWQRNGISDNGIRSQWNPPAIPRRTDENNMPKDIFNLHRHTFLRPYYAWDEDAILRDDQALKREYPYGMRSCCTCQQPRGRQESGFRSRWHRCTNCKRIYCDTCGSALSYPGKLPGRTRKCLKCGSQTELVN